MLNTYVVEGGIGKQVAFTAIIPALKKRDEESIQISSPYVDCYGGNPHVKMVYDLSSIPLNDQRILESDNIIYFEPYKSNFVKGQMHIVESFCQLTGVEYSPEMRPRIYTDHLSESVDKWLKERDIEKYVLVQFTGGQTPLAYAPDKPYQSSNFEKNYPQYFANYIVQQLIERYDVTVIDCSLPNEPHIPGAIKCDLHWAQIHEMMKKAKGWIGIDSCVNHFSASTGVPGVAVWGNTSWVQFGYMHNKNLTFHQTKEYNDYFTPDLNDPRNIQVDPNLVLKVFDEQVWEKDREEVACAHSTD
jgi:ADP-heptose:LPS heptosyltransferase